MKKWLVALVVFVVLSALVTGCGNQAESTQEGTGKAEEESAPEKMNLAIGTGGVAGVYYPIGGGIAGIINQFCPGINATVQTSGAGVENIRLLGQKEIEMGLVQTSSADYAMKGTEVFKDNPVKNIRGVAVLYPQPFQLVVRKDSQINSVYDIKGKRIGVGAPGSGEEATWREVMSVYGLTYKDMDAKMLSLAEQGSHFKDNLLDAMWYVSGTPASGILDVASQIPIRLVPIAGKEADQILEKYPYHIKYTIPAGTYPEQAEPVETLAAPAFLVAREDLPEDVVYQVTKAIFEHLDELKKSHKQAENIKLETALEGVSIPLHPGAEKYYKEVGLIK